MKFKKHILIIFVACLIAGFVLNPITYKASSLLDSFPDFAGYAESQGYDLSEYPYFCLYASIYNGDVEYYYMAYCKTLMELDNISGGPAHLFPEGWSYSMFDGYSYDEDAFLRVAYNVEEESFSCSNKFVTLKETYPSSYSGYENSTILLTNQDIYRGGEIYFFSNYNGADASGVYDSNLGYLKNISIRRLRLMDANGNADVTKDMHRILFDAVSSTGHDVTQDGYSVRVYGQFNVLDKDFNSVTSDMPLIHFADYELDSGKIDFLHTDFFNSVTSGTGEDVVNDVMSGWNMSVLGYLRRDTIYLQIVRTLDDGSVTYGGLVKLSVTSVDYATLEDSYNINTVTPDLDVDDSGYSGSSDEQLGLGTTYDDGNLDVELNGGVDDPTDDFVNSVIVLLNSVQAFPQIISSLFSFLPPWCLTLCSVAFGALIIIFFIKLAK